MSVTISELIGFPVSKEHGDELLKRMSAYNQMTKKELISLLLQHDWELLQTQQTMPKKITKNTMTEYLSEVGSRIQSAIEATHAAEVVARMKQDHYPELFQKVLEMRNAQEDEILKWASHRESSFLGLRITRTQKDLDKAKERRIAAECEIDNFIKEHKEDFK